MRLFFVACICILGCASPAGLKGPGLLPFAPAGLTDAAAKPRKYALVVGINQFQDERFNPLRFAEADARAFAMKLEDFDEIRVLTGEQTSRATVLEALSWLRSVAHGPQDTLALYFSTHGSLGHGPLQSLERYLVLADTRLHLLEQTGLSVRELESTLEQLPAARKALFLAACHSGRGKSHLPEEVARELATRKAPLLPIDERSESLWVFSAAALNEPARENAELGHDVYTHFLLEGFDRGDRDSDGATTAEELHDYARERTYSYTNGRQRPSAQGYVVGTDGVVLRGKASRAPRPLAFSYRPSEEGLWLHIDGVPKGSLPGGVIVEPGQRTLELMDPGSKKVLFRDVRWISAGERIDLSSLRPPPKTYRASVSPLLWVPINHRVRSKVLPVLAGMGVNAALHDGLFQHSELSLRLIAAWGNTWSDGFDEQLTFAVRALGADLFWGRVFRPAHLWEIAPGASIGGLFLERSLGASRVSLTQSAAGPTAQLQVRISFAPSSILHVGSRLGIGTLFLNQDGVIQPHAFFDASLLVSLAL